MVVYYYCTVWKLPNFFSIMYITTYICCEYAELCGQKFFVDIPLYLYQIHSVQKDVDYSHFFNFHDDDNFI